MNKLYEILDNKVNIDQGKKYAIFDFDKTCITNDIQELIYIYQAEHFFYRLEVCDFGKILRVSDNLFPQHICMKEKIKAIEEKAGILYGRICQSERKNETEHAQFIVCMLALLEIANIWCDVNFTYQWVLEFLSDYSKEEIRSLTRNVYEENCIFEDRLITVHQDLLDEFKVNATFRHGISINQRTYGLVKYLKSKNVDIYIVSASANDCVAETVSICEYGKVIDAKNIYALYIHNNNANTIITINEGKEKLIRSKIAPLYDNRPPFLVAGDSYGDYWMITMVKEDGQRVVVGDGDILSSALDCKDLDYFRI